MRAHPLAEARAYADLMLAELRKVIPAFLRRVDLPDRGGAWSEDLAEIRSDARPSPRRGPRIRGFDARRAAQGDPGVPQARGPPRSGWRVVGVPCRDPI